MTRIRSLRANVTREQAMRYFTTGAMSLAADLIRGRVRSLAELYIPYRVFQVRITSSGREQNSFFALDMVRGVLDLYQFPSAPSEFDLLTLETRNLMPTVVDAVQAEEQLIGKVRRLIFSRGFFRVRDLRIETSRACGDICVPYWVSFRGSDRVHLAVLDAVRRRPEGAKVRRMVEEWLRSDVGTLAGSGTPRSSVLS